MKTVLLLAVISFAAFISYSQEPDLNSVKGLRLAKGQTDHKIYANNAKDKPEWKDWRKLNYRVYFRIVKAPSVKKNGTTYILITIPGKSDSLNQSELKIANRGDFPRTGKSISAKDFDQNFWIDSSIVADLTVKEHFKYENNAFSGALTAPFKLRLALGSAPDSYIDGNFNVAPFFGWKFRISRSKPHFVSPFIFAGITTLNYSSSVNNRISDPKIKENGAGYTYGGGVAFRFGTISPGLIFGFDHGVGNLGTGYQYQDKLWISFSLNFEFFKPKELDGSKDKVNSTTNIK